MVVMEASVAQRKANLFRHGVPPGAPAAEGSSGVAAAEAPPRAMMACSDPIMHMSNDTMTMILI